MVPAVTPGRATGSGTPRRCSTSTTSLGQCVCSRPAEPAACAAPTLNGALAAGYLRGVYKGRTSARESQARTANPTLRTEARSADRPEVRNCTESFQVATVALRVAQSDGLERALWDAFAQSFAPGDAARVLCLPGIQAQTPSTWEDSVVAAARKHRADALFEVLTPNGARYRYFDLASDSVGGLATQLFSRSKWATPSKVDALLKWFADPHERRFSSPPREVGLLMCGENNVLANIQKEDNRVVVRHGRTAPILDGADVVFNGAHTLMGNWAKLNKRFEYLSVGRVALYATNNSAGSWCSAVRAYVDGRIVANGAEIINPRGGAVVLVRDGSGGDRFRAIRLVFPLLETSLRPAAR